MIITVIIFFWLIGTVSVVGNFIVLIVVYKSKQLRHSQYVYKCSIAISDIIWGFSISVSYIQSYFEFLNSNAVDLFYIYDDLIIPELVEGKNNIGLYYYEFQEVKMALNYYYDNLFVIISLFTLKYVTPITLYYSSFFIS